MLQNPLVLLTFDKVHNPLRLPRESTSEPPKVVRTPGVFCILTWKCASRHNGVHFFDISTSKSAPYPSVFCAFDLQRCALFRHLNFQKCSGPGALHILTWKRASRHNGVQFFISYLARWLRTRCFSEPIFRPSGATNHWKTQRFTTFLPFRAPASSCFWLFLFSDLLSSDSFSSLIFSLLTLSPLWSSLFYSLLFDSSHRCFSSVHIFGSLTSKLPSIIYTYIYIYLIK